MSVDPQTWNVWDDKQKAALEARLASVSAASDSRYGMVTELVATVSHRSDTINANMSIPVFVAPFACRVTQASMMGWVTSVTASDTDYWTVTVSRYRANVAAVIATKTTRVTGGEAMPQRTDWNFDAVAFDANNQLLAKGDAAAYTFLLTGAPGAIGGYVLELRYEPT